MAERSTIRVRVWLVAILAALGMGAMVALALGAHRAGKRPDGANDEPKAVVAPSNPKLGPGLQGSGLPDSLEGLIALYGRRAGDPAAIMDRESALRALFQESDPSRRLFAVLAAVESDPTPIESDPLWPQVTQQLSETWQGKMATNGLDLMLAETRHRARQAVIASFARLAETGRARDLTWAQRTTMTDDFIDIFKQVSPSQQNALQRGLQGMGNGDLAKILLGKGLHADDELEIQRRYKKALQESAQASATP